MYVLIIIMIALTYYINHDSSTDCICNNNSYMYKSCMVLLQQPMHTNSVNIFVEYIHQHNHYHYNRLRGTYWNYTIK